MSSGFVDLPRAVVMNPFLTDDWAAAIPDSSRPSYSGRMPDLRTLERRRERRAAASPGDALLVPVGVPRTRSADIAHKFRPHSAHVWLTGNQSPEAVLLIDDGESTLYVRGRSGPETKEFWEDRRTGEFWAGPRPSIEEAAELFGIRCRDLDRLPHELPERARTRVIGGVDPELDRLVGAQTEADLRLEVESAGLRRVKDAWELAELAGAVHQTLLGFDDCIREWSRARYEGERWLETTFERRARFWGNGVGYNSMVGSGRHSATLHWIENDGSLEADDLVLMDMGVEARSLYTADITRTVPVNGTWSAVQRDLYELVLASQEAGIAAMVPGAPFRAFHRVCVEVLSAGLIDMGLLQCSLDEALDPSSTLYGRWVLCGSGHVLGLDVHDCRGAGRDVSLDSLLEPGEALTVEPGVYFQPNDLKVPEELRGTGIRIEDDLVVTADGSQNLSAALPRTSDDVEAWMAGRSLDLPAPVDIDLRNGAT